MGARSAFLGAAADITDGDATAGTSTYVLERLIHVSMEGGYDVWVCASAIG